MAIIWPFSSSIEEYVKRGKDIDVPRPDCPKCSVPMVFWSSYKRYVRHLGKDLTICIKRARCKGCKVTDSLLPSFLLLNRLDCIETIGTAVEAVFGEGSTIMAAGLGAGVPYTTTRGWIRSFNRCIIEIGSAFAALVIELGGDVTSFVDSYKTYALGAITNAYESVTKLPGWGLIGMWEFVSVVSGGRIIATNINSPYLLIGKRCFIYPVPYRE